MTSPNQKDAVHQRTWKFLISNPVVTCPAGHLGIGVRPLQAWPNCNPASGRVARHPPKVPLAGTAGVSMDAPVMWGNTLSSSVSFISTASQLIIAMNSSRYWRSNPRNFTSTTWASALSSSSAWPAQRGCMSSDGNSIRTGARCALKALMHPSFLNAGAQVGRPVANKHPTDLSSEPIQA